MGNCIKENIIGELKKLYMSYNLALVKYLKIKLKETEI